MRTLRYTCASFFIALMVCAFWASIALAQATTDSSQITDCSRAQQLSSVGQTTAQGSYVPVSEAAVMANTSRNLYNIEILRYKECVLRPLVNAQRKAATATIVRNGTNSWMTGRNGGPLFAQQMETERLFLASDPQILLSIANGTFDTLHNSFGAAIKNTIGQGYFRATRQHNNSLTCPYQGNLNAALNGSPQGSVHEALWALGNPACNPRMAAELATQMAFDYTDTAVENLNTNWDWGQGTYPRLQLDAAGRYVFTTDTTITTPASLARDMELQLLTSGLRQQESANNVNEMVSNLFANIGTQIISNNQGMNSLIQPSGGGGTGASYLDQVVSQSGGQLTQTSGNAALQILNAALALERTYNQAVSAIADILRQTNAQLRAVERQCWTSIIQKVCVAGSVSANNTSCTGTSGNNLTRIATSTAFSQAVINNNIAPLASTTLINLAKSNAAITQINQFITTVANNPGSQATVLSQFNQLSSQGAFHTQSDVTSAQSQQQTVTSATGNLVQNTINTWAGTDTDGNSTIPWDHSIYPGTGWCNYQSQQTLGDWDQQWR